MNRISTILLKTLACGSMLFTSTLSYAEYKKGDVVDINGMNYFKTWNVIKLPVR